MKSKNNIIFLIVSVFLLSCVLFIVHTIPDNEVLGTVYFFNGKTERYVTVDFNHIKQLNDCTDVTDTIAIERIIADEIITGLSHLSPTSVKDLNQSMFMYICIGDNELAINENNGCIFVWKPGILKTATLDNRTSYLIKWKTGYYNTISKDNLKYDIGIQQFGIPDDLNNQKEPASFGPEEEVSKLMLVIK